MLEEPHDIENAPVIHNTLQIHRLIKEIGDGKAIISFFNLSYDVGPVYVKDYKNILKCSHTEKEFQSLAMMKNTCSYCMGVKKIPNEDWLKCAVCRQWFRDSCFHS